MKVLIAILKMIAPWSFILAGVFFVCPTYRTGASLASISLGILILIDIYLSEYCKS